MNSRKRKNSTIPETDAELSKRARLLSTLWKSQEDQSKSPAKSQDKPSSPVYKIKAIIGEKPAEYLIDWADDLIAGEIFTPDWVSETKLLKCLGELRIDLLNDLSCYCCFSSPS